VIQELISLLRPQGLGGKRYKRPFDGFVLVQKESRMPERALRIALSDVRNQVSPWFQGVPVRGHILDVAAIEASESIRIRVLII